MKTLGFIVNPIAGMGGAVGLKGTDGKEILDRAVVLGAKPIAPARAQRFLLQLEPVKTKINLLVGPRRMGECEAQRRDLSFTVIGERKDETTAEDTRQIAKMMTEGGVDLVAFCGGDGTARDILDVVDTRTPLLGIPTGVKMHSAVFAVSPESAASIAVSFLRGELPLREAEVMDVDEEAFRDGRLSAKLYGYMLVPYEPNLVQTSKMASPVTDDEMKNQAALAIYMIEGMKPDVIYIVGPGTTTRTLGDLLDEKKTLLGVDLFCNRKIIAKDVNEREILERIRGKAAKIIITPVGGQGFIFGRGNQQISPTVIKEVGIRNIIVIATRYKLAELKCLRVDTGDSILDRELRGYVRVIADYKEERIVHVT